VSPPQSANTHGETDYHNAINTGYNQSIRGCGFQRRQCSCYSTKTHVNSMILILKLNSTSLRNIYIKSGLRWATHTSCISFRCVITTCLRWEPQPVMLWLYPVIKVLLQVLLHTQATFTICSAFFLFYKQEWQTDTRYACHICGKFNGNDNIFGSRILDLESRYH